MGSDRPNPGRSMAMQRCSRAKYGRFSSHVCQQAPRPWMKTIGAPGPEPRSTYSTPEPWISSRCVCAGQSTSSHAGRPGAPYCGSSCGRSRVRAATRNGDFGAIRLPYPSVPSRIAIDIDSTLHHYWDQLREVVRRRHGIDLPYEDQTTWQITALPQEHLAAAVLETHGAEHVLAAVPYPGAVETVRRWHEAGHFIHITSHRTIEAQAATARWLEQVGLPYDELYCSYDKVSRCAEIGIDVLIDDAPVNLERAHEVGVLGATLLHPWNREFEEVDWVVTAEDWAGLSEALVPHLARLQESTR